jgi:hypothetical protein
VNACAVVETSRSQNELLCWLVVIFVCERTTGYRTGNTVERAFLVVAEHELQAIERELQAPSNEAVNRATSSVPTQVFNPFLRFLVEPKPGICKHCRALFRLLYHTGFCLFFFDSLLHIRVNQM